MKIRNQAGFTLIELAVVCLLVIILGDLAIPQIEASLSVYRLSASANLVAAELNAGRAMAVSRNWNYDVELLADGGTNYNSLPTIRIIDAGNRNNDPRLAQPLQQGISFTSVVTTIKFYSRGHADTGTVTLQNLDGRTIAVQILSSGKVQIGDIS